MKQKDTGEKDLQTYLDISEQAIRKDLLAIHARSFPPAGQRQEAFNPVETLLCYGLFKQVNPHRYGGGNIGQVPEIVKVIAVFFRRTPGSITSKMLNLEGVRPYFDDLLSSVLILPATAKKPALSYLEYHRQFIFRDGLTSRP